MTLFAFALFAVFFEAPLTAAAVAGSAVSIPIIIHLLNRRRFRIVEWAAMRFLLTAQRKNARRMRLEQWLLLVVRCLIVLFLIMAMASVSPWAEAMWRAINPAGGKDQRPGSARTHRIIVLDASLSMGVKLGEGNCFDRARELAAQVVEEGAGNDGFSVVLMAAPPRRIVPEPSEDAGRVAGEIRRLQLTHGNADLTGTLTTVANMLKSSPAKFPAKEVYFITDLQRSSWISARPGDLAPALDAFREHHARANFIDVGRDGVNNLAVTGLEIGEPVATTHGKIPIVATLFNHGETRDDVAVRLFVGRARSTAQEKPCALHEEATATVHAQRGQQTPVSFTYQFPSPGDYVLQVQTSHDDLEMDDVRSVLVRVKNTVPVLLVNGKSAPERFDRAAEWARVALNPYADRRDVPAGTVARPKVVSAAQFVDEKMGDLTDIDAVFLCDVPRLRPAEVRRLEAHVRRGGALLVGLGDGVDLGNYNDLLYARGEGLLPARLLGIQNAGPGFTYQLTMDPEADRTDPLRLFQDSTARERLLAPFFSTFIQSDPAKALRGIAPRKLLGFMSLAIPGRRKGPLRTTPPPGGPAVLEWMPPLPGKNADKAPDKSQDRVSGRGRVVLFTSTLNADWNRWPTSPAFPAFLQETMLYAAAARLRERSLVAGEPIELYLNNTAAVEATIEVPRDRIDNPESDDAIRRQSSQALGDGTVLRFGETDISGIYKVRLGQHPREYLYAVNVPTSTDDQKQSESNLARTSKEELERTYPEWDVQVVTRLDEVKHRPVTAGNVTVYAPQGNFIARIVLRLVLLLTFAEIILAWQFGHYSPTTVQPGAEPARQRTPPWRVWTLRIVPWVLFGVLGLLGTILIHNAWTGDFLGFLPDTTRGLIERAFDVPNPATGEGSRWRLEYTSYLYDGKSDPWLVGALALFALGSVVLIYRQEGNAIKAGFRALLVSLRLGLILVLLVVLLPQLSLHFERQGWPDIAILIDDSQSMSAIDTYRDDAVRAAADALAGRAALSDEEKTDLDRAIGKMQSGGGGVSLTRASRLRLAQTLLTSEGDTWLRNLMEKRKVRLHIYRCSARADRIADVTTPDELEGAVEAIGSLTADANHDSSQLGSAVRQVLNDFRGTSLSGILLLTDGVTTEGENLGGVAKYAAQMGVPLFFIGIGDAQEQRDLSLHDLQVAEAVYVNDRIIFNLRLSAQGFKNLTVPVSLYEKGKDRALDSKTVTIEPNTRTVAVKLSHRPTEPGEKVYVIRVPVQEGEVDRDNNQIERTIHVQETKQIKVLYVEGYRRYEYHYLKSLLERESNRLKGNKSIFLKVVLLNADEDFYKQDRTVLKDGFPTPFRNTDIHTRDEDLWSYDVVILGDVNPEPNGDSKITEHLKNLAEFVRERGGGLLVLSGERFMPRAYKNSPLKDVLPIDLTGERAKEVDPDDSILDTYRPELTAIGRMHPIFRFSEDEAENTEIWGRLKEFYWHADGYLPKRAAEVLATHPSLKLPGKAGQEGENFPLVLQQFAGSGRCLFFGFDETWRWNWREDQGYFNSFWVQAVRYLARTRVGKIDLRLDRQTPYRRGQPIQVMVRFPDDEKPPSPQTEVKVSVERRVPGKESDRETRTIKLARKESSRATYEAFLTQTPEGDYRFTLIEPSAKPRPQVECKVLAPPGEMELLQMNQAEMEQAATVSQGKFYTLATADRFINELPTGNRVTINASGPPWLVWNSLPLFLLVLGLLTMEWLLRKQKNLL